MRNYMKVLAIGLLLAVFGVASGNADNTTVNAVNDGNLQRYRSADVQPDDYYTTRNQTSSWTVENSTTAIHVGQTLAAGYYYIWRGFLAFPLNTLAGATAVACTLYIDGAANNSVTDFNLFAVYGKEYKPLLDIGDYDGFTGWATSGAYSPVYLSNALNTSSYSNGANGLIFTTAGKDSVHTAFGDTLWVAILSYEDISNSAPTDGEDVTFDGSADANKPYLSINYTPAGWSGTIGNLTNPAAVGAYSKSEIKEIR